MKAGDKVVIIDDIISDDEGNTWSGHHIPIGTLVKILNKTGSGWRVSPTTNSEGRAVMDGDISDEPILVYAAELKLKEKQDE